MTQSVDLKYYVYRHIRPDTGVPFYVGLGTKPEKFTTKTKEYRRAYNVSSRRRSKFWYRVYKKNNEKFDVEIVFECNDRKTAENKEKEFIKLYGRIDLGYGTLVNMTDGGDGMIGHTASEETKRKIGKAHKGRKFSEESLIKMSLSKKGLQTRLGAKLSEETKNKISKGNTGKKSWLGKRHSKDSLEKMRLAKLGRKHPPEFGEAISKRNLGIKRSEEAKRRMSVAQLGNKNALGKKQTLEHITLRTNSIRGRQRTAEQKLRMSIACKASHDMGLRKPRGKKK